MQARHKKNREELQYEKHRLSSLSGRKDSSSQEVDVRGWPGLHCVVCMFLNRVKSGMNMVDITDRNFVV